MLKKIAIVANLFLISGLQFVISSASAQILDDDLYYRHQGESSLLVKSDLEKDEETPLFLNDGDVLTVLDEILDQNGEYWLRFGLEKKSNMLFAEEGPVDFWLRREQFAKLNISQEILARMTYCYRYVKKYLLKKGFVDTYLPGASAYMAATILPKHGFTKVERQPTKATQYDVCVYRGGPSGHGHIEVLDPQGWYYGYGYKKQPIKNRTFTGCFYKKLK